jgi:hypothetical protein
MSLCQIAARVRSVTCKLRRQVEAEACKRRRRAAIVGGRSPEPRQPSLKTRWLPCHRTAHYTHTYIYIYLFYYIVVFFHYVIMLDCGARA